MTEAFIGYMEGVFLALAILLLAIIAWNVFRPSRRSAMEDAARIPFRHEEEDHRG